MSTRLFLLVWLFVGLCAAQGRLLSPFSLAIGFAEANVTHPEVSITTTDPSLFGGERIFTAMLIGTAPPNRRILCGITDINFMSLSSDAGLRGSCMSRYGGINNAGISPPEDLSEFDCFLVHVIEADNNGFDISVVASSNGNDVVSSYNQQEQIDPPGKDICLPYQLPLSTYESIDALTLIVTADMEDADGSLDFFCVAPAVRCWHEVDLLGNDPILLGDMISVSVTCENYLSSPPTIQRTSMSMDFGSIGATLNSVVCSNNVVPVVNGNTFTTETMFLDEQERGSCSFVLTMNQLGSTGDFAFTITNLFTSAQTISSVLKNTTNSMDLCSPSIPLNLQVGPRPPTEPTAAPSATPPAEPSEPSAPSASPPVEPSEPSAPSVPPPIEPSVPGPGQPTAPSGVSGDPHFKGFLGQVYDFHGVPHEVFNIITSPSLQMNSFFVDADLRPMKKKTYLGEIGIRLCNEKDTDDTLLFIACDRTKQRQIITLNDKPMAVGERAKFGQTTIRRSNLLNNKVTIVSNLYEITVRFSQSAHSSCHLNLRCSYAGPSDLPHGILGQSVRRPENAIGEGWNSPNIVEGEMEDYIEKNAELFGSSFKFNRYDPSTCAMYKPESRRYHSGAE